MNIAEKILGQFDPNEEYDEYYHQTHILAAMTEYGAFMHYLGTQGLEQYDGWDRWVDKNRRVHNISDLYDDYITNWKPKED